MESSWPDIRRAMILIGALQPEVSAALRKSTDASSPINSGTRAIRRMVSAISDRRNTAMSPTGNADNTSGAGARDVVIATTPPCICGIACVRNSAKTPSSSTSAPSNSSIHRTCEADPAAMERTWRRRSAVLWPCSHRRTSKRSHCSAYCRIKRCFPNPVGAATTMALRRPIGGGAVAAAREISIAPRENFPQGLLYAAPQPNTGRFKEEPHGIVEIAPLDTLQIRPQ